MRRRIRRRKRGEEEERRRARSRLREAARAGAPARVGAAAGSSHPAAQRGRPWRAAAPRGPCREVLLLQRRTSSEKPCTSEVNWRDEAEDKEESKRRGGGTPVGALCPAALRFASAGCRLPPLVGGRGYIWALTFGANAGERSEGPSSSVQSTRLVRARAFP